MNKKVAAKPKMNQPNKELDRLKQLMPIYGEIEKYRYPKWLDYDGLCQHDDGYFCEHRRDYVLNLIHQSNQEAKRMARSELGHQAAMGGKMTVYSEIIHLVLQGHSAESIGRWATRHKAKLIEAELASLD